MKIKGNVIDTDTITAGNIAPNAVGASEITDGTVGAADLAATLDLSSKAITMPPNGSRAGEVVQVVNTQTGASTTGTTVIPADDTIPQNTEGDEYMTLAVTPTSATNKLKIEVVIVAANSAATQAITAALFQDAAANALAAQAERYEVGGAMVLLTFTHYMVAGTTSATTFKVRAGGSAAGTTTFNGSGGTRRYGGVLASSITITEIKV